MESAIAYHWRLRTFYFLAVLALAGFLPMQVQAQEIRVDAVVEFIAGENIYLNIGTDEGIAETDTLFALRDNQVLGALRVVGLTASRTVTTFAGAPFAVTRGDALTIVVQTGFRPTEEIADDQPTDPVDTPERRSVFEGGRTGTQLPPVEEGIRITGRLSVSMDLLNADTEGLRSSFTRERTYRIPVINLRTRIEELPAGLRINLNARYAHRNNESRLGINPENALRIYQLNVERLTLDSPFQARLGRFFNPAESFSGFWDGLNLAYVPDTGFGAGVLGGFQPLRANEDFTTDMPKYTVFGSYAYRSDDGSQRYNANLSFHQVFPESPLSTHTFFGLVHTYNLGRMRIRNFVQLDQNPANDEWTVTRLQAYGSIPLSTNLTFRSRYILRRPYQVLLTDNIIGYQRERVSGGLTLRALSGSFSADIATNTSDIDARSYTYSGFVAFPALTDLRIGFNTMVHFWDRDDGADVLFVAPTLSRQFNRIYTQLQYQYQKSNFDVIEATNHALEWSFNVPLGARVRSSIRLQSRWGDATSTFRVYTTLWTRI